MKFPLTGVISFVNYSIPQNTNKVKRVNQNEEIYFLPELLYFGYKLWYTDYVGNGFLLRRMKMENRPETRDGYLGEEETYCAEFEFFLEQLEKKDGQEILPDCSSQEIDWDCF